MVCVLVVLTHMYAFIETHQTVYLKCCILLYVTYSLMNVVSTSLAEFRVISCSNLEPRELVD